MRVEYEVLIILVTGVLAFATGMKKAKSTCCCCSLDWERDGSTNQLQGVKVVKRSSVKEDPVPPPRNPIFNMFN
tara:strand:- start:775 stop:996 length:222 start_codon:yes stop_codon:yes gene_type:complete